MVYLSSDFLEKYLCGDCSTKVQQFQVVSDHVGQELESARRLRRLSVSFDHKIDMNTIRRKAEGLLLTSDGFFGINCFGMSI